MNSNPVRLGLAILLACFLAGPTLADGILAQFNAPDLPTVGSGTPPSNTGQADIVTVTGQITAAQGTGSARLLVTAEMAAGWHIYSTTQAPGGPIATTITVDPSSDFELAGAFQPDTAPHLELSEVFGDLMVEEHEGQVTWSVPIKLADGVDPAKLQITGNVRAQSCNATGCLPPKNFSFVAAHSVATDVVMGAYQADAVKQSPAADSPKKKYNVATALLIGFAAGFILNFMPCVLPVIGLKVMSFVHQAGESRGRVFTLNLWYVLGLFSVFMVLATLAVFLKLGWGEQFQGIAFKIVLASILFVFALSFLGVWEIPIPGFVGTGKANEMAAKEGPTGAFFKGVLTTVLATPCTGPLLIPMLNWSVTQPAAVQYGVFGSAGLGMALPYLVIGAFPKLVGFLPKPGAWMETFKQTMGFVLLATVIWLFYTMRSTPDYFVPTLAFLFGLWAACWWIGRTPLTAQLGAKVKAWSIAAVIATVVGFFAFVWETKELPWQPYTRVALEEYRANGATVLVDFTADW